MPNTMVQFQPTVAPGSASPEAAASGPPKVPGSDKNFQARIDELVARENFYKRKASELEARLAEHQDRLSRVEGRTEALNTPKSSSAARDWVDLDDNELDQAVEFALSDESKPKGVVSKVFREQLRRGVEKAVAQATSASKKEIEQTQLLRDTNARILQDFGAEAFDETTPLFEAAYRHMQEYVRIYGKDEVLKRPTFRYDAFLRAEREIKTPAERERLQKLEQENQTLQTRASLLERGGSIGAAPKPSDEVRELLKSGGPKAAIKGLKLTQNFVQDVQRRALPQ